MKFITDDDRFGVVIAPSVLPHMYRFRLVFDGELVGDAEPCILGSAIKRLGSLGSIDDPRLDPTRSDAESRMSLLQADERLHGAALLSLAESLDDWSLRGYIYKSDVVFMARRHRPKEFSGKFLTTTVDSAVYSSLIAIIRIYWLKFESLEA